MTQNRAHRVRFGTFEADFHTQELWQGSTRLKLARQPFQILETLVGARGQLVTREDLQRRLWAEDHFVDAAHGLNAAINKLREALGDSADQPRFIETLPRRGYRFIGRIESDLPVDKALAQDDAPADANPTPAALPALPLQPVPGPILAFRSFSSRWLLLSVALAALAIGGAIGISLTGNACKPMSPDYACVPEALQKEQAALSKSQDDLKVTRETLARNGEIATITEAPAQTQRRESTTFAQESVPDRVPAAFNAPQVPPEAHVALQTADFRTIVAGDAGNAAPQFSPDGTRIAFMSNRSGPWQIWLSRADGSNPRQVSFTESAGTPRWAPDGQSIAFDAPQDGITSVFIAQVDHPEGARPVAEGRVPSFSRDGQFLYFASARTDDWQVWKAPVRGGTAVQVTRSGGFAALESDDGNLYYVKSQHEPQLWKIPVNGGVESLVSPLARPRTWSSWTVTCEGILLAMDLPDGKTHLSLYEPRRGSMRELVSLQSAPHWMGATLDGKKVVVNDAAERQITMLDNLR